MEPEPLVYREEVTAMLFSILDIEEHLRRIRRLLEEAANGEDSEDDA